MWPKLRVWTRYYSPSILLLLELILLFFLIRTIIFQVAWAEIYQNGEPIAAGLQSTAQMRLQERSAFQNLCAYNFTVLGIISLAAYVLYLLSGLFHLPHTVHVTFCKQVRNSIMAGNIAVCVGMVTSLFVWNGYPPLLNTLGIIIGGISLGVYFFQNLFMLRDTVKKKLDRRVGAIGMFVMFLLFFVLLCLLQAVDIIVAILNTIKAIIQASYNPYAVTLTNHFVLSTPVDFILPLVYFMVPLLLWFAMKYASPIRACTPLSGKVITLVHE